MKIGIDKSSQEILGEALLEARKLLPERKLSEVHDFYLKLGGIEAGGTLTERSASVVNDATATRNGSPSVGPRGEGVVESGDS